MTRVVRVKDLRDEHNTVESVTGSGPALRARRVGFYSRLEMKRLPHSPVTVIGLQKFFRVTTAGWDTVRWAWDKKNTYDRAAELGIPVPQHLQPQD